jgi:hypothetical protein
MRAFFDADLIQAGSGTAALASSASVTVPAGTAEGNTGIICLLAGTVIAAPAQWDLAARDSTGVLAVMCRGDLPGTGESSWPFTLLGGASGNWAWTCGEWANTAPAPVESSSSATGAGADPSLSTGSTGTFGAQYVMGIAAFGIQSSGGSAWPSVSYDSGFTETDSQQVGDGTASGDILLKVARRYGTDSDAGPWSCTATFTGSMTSKTPRAALVVFRAAETADAPVVLAS